MFQHLNHDNLWPQVRRFGLEVDPESGALTLRRLPGPPQSLLRVPGMPSDTPTPAGMAVGTDGSVFLSDPRRHQVYRVDPLQQEIAPLTCLGAGQAGWEVGQLNTPRGLAFQACRQRLLIADAENRRIQVVDPRQERVVAVWGQTWPYEYPRSCDPYGGLDRPVQLACDQAGNVYVIDVVDVPGQESPSLVKKLTADGDMTEVSFACGSAFPVHVAVGRWQPPTGKTPRECVFVLAFNPTSNELRLCVFDPNGKLVIPSLKLLHPDLLAESGGASAPVSMVLYGLAIDSPDHTQQTAGPLGTMSAVHYALEERATEPQGYRGTWYSPVSAFTVIGTTAVVALPSRPSRLWCFAIGEALASGDPDAVEPSWLPQYDGPAEALSIRGDPYSPCDAASLLLCAGPGRDLYTLPHRGAYRTQGAFLAGPLPGSRGQATQWRRLRFDGRMSENGHVQWFTLSRSEQDFGRAGPLRPFGHRLPSWFRYETQPDLFTRLGFALATETLAEAEPDEFAPIRRPGALASALDPERVLPNAWCAAPENQFDILVRNTGGTPNEPADQLWLLGLIAGDGQTSPTFFQARLEHDDQGWLDALPQVFQRNSSSRQFLSGLLALFQSRLEDVTETIDRLPALFSPEGITAQYGSRSAELDWLRTVLAFPATPPRACERQDRRHAQAFREGPHWLARRCLPEGLQRLVWLATGVDVVIDEPGLDETFWSLGGATLEAGVTLAPTEPDGLPLPAAAATPGSWPDVVGYATLPDPQNPRVRLPDDLAHHFVVRGYEPELAKPELRELVTRVVERLAPAHTTYSVQVIEPRARVGAQARLGIDAVVADCAPAHPLTLDEPDRPDTQLDPGPLPPLVGTIHLGGQTNLL